MSVPLRSSVPPVTATKQRKRLDDVVKLHAAVSAVVSDVLPLQVTRDPPEISITLNDKGTFLRVTVVVGGALEFRIYSLFTTTKTFPADFGCDGVRLSEGTFYATRDFVNDVAVAYALPPIINEVSRCVKKLRYFYSEPPSLAELFSNDGADCADCGGGESKQGVCATDWQQFLGERGRELYDTKTQQLRELAMSEPKMLTRRFELSDAMVLSAANFMLASEELREDLSMCVCLCLRDYHPRANDRTPEDTMATLFAHMRVELTPEFVARAFDIFQQHSDWRRMRTFLSVFDNIPSDVKGELMKGVVYFPPFGRKMPNQFLCPIMHAPMRDPVITSDGHTYDRVNIKKWFDGGNDTSPLTNLRIAVGVMPPNFALKSMMDDMCCTYTLNPPGKYNSRVEYVYVYAATRTVRIVGDTLKCWLTPQGAMKREHGGEYGGYLHRLKLTTVEAFVLFDKTSADIHHTDHSLACCQLFGFDGWVFRDDHNDDDDSDDDSDHDDDAVEVKTEAALVKIDELGCSCVMLGQRKFRDAVSKAVFEGQDMQEWWENSVFDSNFSKVSKFATE